MGKSKGGARVRVKQQAPVNPLAGLTIPPEEMIHFPPKPDPNTSYPWPILEAMSMDWSNFNVIYPSYMDSNKTVKMGRRISSTNAIPEPTAQEIGEALRVLRIRHVVQPYKGYSRDAESRWDNPGRVRVDMKGDLVPNLMPGVTSDDALMANIGQFENKKDLLKEIARIIPNLNIRVQRLAEKKRMEEEERRKEKERLLAKSKASSTSGSKPASRKKKGKKKR